MPAKMPAKRKPIKETEPRKLGIQMSTQFKLALAALPRKEQDALLSAIGEIAHEVARGRCPGKPVDASKLPEDVRRSIEAAHRELSHQKPERA
jgi:hypothetical protein